MDPAFSAAVTTDVQQETAKTRYKIAVDAERHEDTSDLADRDILRIHTHIHTCIHTYLSRTYVRTYIHTCRQTDRQTYIHTDRQIYIHTNRQTDRRIYIHTSGWIFQKVLAEIVQKGLILSQKALISNRRNFKKANR